MSENRFESVELEGFKGRRGKTDLSRPLVLSGRNGAGKSAIMEGLTWALSGVVKAGRTLDAVSQYFPPQGGYVTVRDATGAWLSRTLIRNPKTGKCSEEVDTSSREIGKPADLAPWQSEAAVLDLRALFGLAAAGRREFALRLCGSGDLDKQAVMERIARAYAKEVGGPGANPDGLTAADELPEKVRKLWDSWLGHDGMEDELTKRLFAIQHFGGSQALLGLSEHAKEQRLGAARARKAGPPDERPVGTPLSKEKHAALKARLLEIDRALGEGATVEGTWAEAVRALERAKGHLRTAEEKYSALELELAQARAVPIPEPGEEPARPPVVSAENGLERLAERRVAEAAQAIRLRQAAERDLEEAKNEAAEYLLDLQGLMSSAVGRLVGYLEDRRGAVDEWTVRLCELVDQVAKEWRERRERLLADEKIHRDTLKAAEEALAAFSPMETLQANAAVLEDRLLAIRKERQEAEQAYRAAWDAWNGRMQHRDRTHARTFQLEEQLKTAKKHLQGQGDAVTELLERVKELQGKRLDPVSREIMLQEAQGIRAALEADAVAGARAVEVSNAREAYARLELEEEAWKLAEKAIATVRETYVSRAVAPLLEGLQAVFQEAGRQETPYIDLENEKGRPIFELGWVRDGERIPFESLSGGEGAIFAAGLQASIALLSPGRKLLLVEADTLDPGNLKALLAALSPLGERLDALIVSTCHPVPDAPGWNVQPLVG